VAGGPDRGRGTADQARLAGIVEPLLLGPGRSGWTMRPDAMWCHVLPPARPQMAQGWKLHISATPLSAPAVLARAAEVLVCQGSAFKFARSVSQVAQLTARRVNRASGGKFITVYPDADPDLLRDLAEALHQATAGLSGPGILSDRRYRTGSLVHYRFGAFTAVTVLGNDGMREMMLTAPDGTLVTDQRNAWFCPPPWAPPDPFGQPAGGSVPRRPESVLLAGRYVVRQVIRHSFAGGVFRAEDQRTGRPVIIKQARPYAAVSPAGRDACHMRRHEARMLRRLGPTGATARLVELFEQQGDLFLVMEQVDGMTLRDWVPDHPLRAGHSGWGPDPAAAGRIARDLVDMMDLIHQRGLVLHDFNPSNVMVTAGDRLRLIDLEMLTPFRQQVPPELTPGYAAPEQRPGIAADPAADLYSLGATLFYLVSGADPVMPADDTGVRSQSGRLRDMLTGLTAGNPVATRLAPVIGQFMDEDPGRRPGLASVRQALAAQPGPARRPARPSAAFRLDRAGLDRAIDHATGYLADVLDPASKSRLWPCDDQAAASDPSAVYYGAAGILATLIRAHREQPQAQLTDLIALAANWTRQRICSEPRILPGLYFGHAGTAWAMLEAGQLLNNHDLIEAARCLADRLPLRWPNQDVCHGAAGAGLAQLRFFELTGQQVYLDRAAEAATWIAAAARHIDGLLMWPIPEDFPSRLAGARHLGFAHGVAGIGTFLLAAGHATGVHSYHDLAMRAVDTLTAAREADHGAAYWPAAPGGQRRTHWCSGSSGVGTFLIRAWEHNHETSIKDLATSAATAVYLARWRSGPSQCHGLAGDAEFLLDLAQALGEPRYLTWAHELACCIYARHALRSGRMLAPDDTGTAITAGYGTGQAGTLAFLLRLRYGGPRMWLPENSPAARNRPASEPAAADRILASPAPAQIDDGTQSEGGEAHGN
jgi:hypothetical protein